MSRIPRLGKKPPDGQKPPDRQRVRSKQMGRISRLGRNSKMGRNSMRDRISQMGRSPRWIKAPRWAETLEGLHIGVFRWVKSPQKGRITSLHCASSGPYTLHTTHCPTSWCLFTHLSSSLSPLLSFSLAFSVTSSPSPNFPRWTGRVETLPRGEAKRGTENQL